VPSTGNTWDSGAVSKTFTVFGTTSGVLIPKLNLCSVKRLEDQQVFGSKQIKGSKQVLTDTIQIDSLDKYNRGSAKDCEGFAIYSRVPSVLYCITGSAKHGEGFANLYITTSESQVCFTLHICISILF
jgi:hypothetical protein